MKLFMILLGAAPATRNTEQHDVFFGIGENLADLKTDMMEFWPEAGDSLHIDVYREVNYADGCEVKVVPAGDGDSSNLKLFFLNLGGYKRDEFEEYHYKMISVAADKANAIRTAKQTAFFKHYNIKGAESHIDEKYGIDVDDLYMIEDILPDKYKAQYKILVQPSATLHEDPIVPGYLKLNKL